MNREHQQIKLAQLVGWSIRPSTYAPGAFCLHDPSGKQRGGSWWTEDEVWRNKIRGYPRMPDIDDLNSMQAVERAVLKDDHEWERYVTELRRLMLPLRLTRYLVGATSAQRTEALLRAKGQWSNEKLCNAKERQ